MKNKYKLKDLLQTLQRQKYCDINTILEIKRNILILLEEAQHTYDYDDIFGFLLIDPQDELAFLQVYYDIFLEIKTLQLHVTEFRASLAVELPPGPGSPQRDSFGQKKHENYALIEQFEQNQQDLNFDLFYQIIKDYCNKIWNYCESQRAFKKFLLKLRADIMHYVKYSLSEKEPCVLPTQGWTQLHAQFKVPQLYEDLESIRCSLKLLGEMMLHSPLPKQSNSSLQFRLLKRDFQILRNNVLIEYLLNLKYRVDDSSQALQNSQELTKKMQEKLKEAFLEEVENEEKEEVEEVPESKPAISMARRSKQKMINIHGGAVQLLLQQDSSSENDPSQLSSHHNFPDDNFQVFKQEQIISGFDDQLIKESPKRKGRSTLSRGCLYCYK